MLIPPSPQLPSRSVLTAATFAYTRRAGITAAAGTRLALSSLSGGLLPPPHFNCEFFRLDTARPPLQHC